MRCGSAGIVPGVRVMGRASHGGEYDLGVRVDADPDAFVFKEAMPSYSRRLCVARWNPVCDRCTYTEFYPVDPAALFGAWRRSQEFPIG